MQGVNQSVTMHNKTYYPSSIDNMRLTLESIKIDDALIEVDKTQLPRFMQTAQTGSYSPTEYIPVVVLCYATPKDGSKIISRIKKSKFDFKLLDFEVDRIIVQQSTDYATAKYLILERQSIGDPIKTDNQLFGMDWAENPEGTVRLDDESGNPINRNYNDNDL